jgi:hypothetical protein
MDGVGYLGYVECDNCTKYVYIDSPADIQIWYHPDDPKPLAEAICNDCGHVITSRIDFLEMANFRKRGCIVRDFNDKFPPLTEQMIDEWDDEAIEAELYALVD